MQLPQSYIIDKIYQYTHRPVFKRGANVYNFECPICNEGGSRGKKRRGFFIIERGNFYCHNCQRSWGAVDWIMQVARIDYRTVLKESQQYTDSLDQIISQKEHIKKPTYTLPKDCLNLTDETQLQFYKDDPIVNYALEYIKKRRLLTAINHIKTYYISLTDEYHRNRLVIPFYDENGKIIFFQSRALLEKDEKVARYLSKSAEIPVFGLDRIDLNYEYLFQLEGPIDSLFVKNGIAMCGLSLNDLQRQQLEKYRFHKRIWILDNELDNPTVRKKYLKIINSGERIFFFPKKFAEFKDLNEICVNFGLDQISPNFFINNSFTGLEAQMRLGE